MNSPDKFLLAGINLIDEGLIAIDQKGKIKVYNDKASTIFGIDPRIGPGHEEGSVEKGDIVILANNALGKDDGNLSPEDLKDLGVNPIEIEPGDGIVVIGEKAGTGNAKFIISKDHKSVIEVSKISNGISVYSGIDFEKKQIVIRVGENQFDFFYTFSAGHLVVLDKHTLKIKFYQTRGYTARREDLKSILNGCRYDSKGPGAEMPVIFNKHIHELHPDSEIIERLLNTARGKTATIENIETVINGIPTRCSLKAIDNAGHVIGAVLKVDDISAFKSLLQERDAALASVRTLEERLQRNETQQKAFANIIGTSEKIKSIIELACKASETSSNVLILGESGTGKGILAESIHQASGRREGPFVYLNCAAIPENLLESELFGYEKGSFTGALAAGKSGKFEQAHRGTIFLDELAELSLPLQAKILHVFQSKLFTRVGGLKPIKADVRIIAATNKNLKELVQKGIFREDLYYRINVISINIPPLRERRQDIPALIKFLLPAICEKVGKKAKKISEEAINLLLHYHWRGNVRELENIMERAANIAPGDVIGVEHLPDEIKSQKFMQSTTSGCLVSVIGLGPLEKAVKETEGQLIVKALEHTRGSRKEAMKVLQIGKTSFYQKLKEYTDL